MQHSGKSSNTDVFGFISSGETKPPGDDDVIPF